MYFYDVIPTTIGNITLVASDNGLKQIIFDSEKKAKTLNDKWKKDPFKLKDTREQLLAYFNKELTRFNVPLDPDGTNFQKQIWDELLKIPYGTTCSYQDIANAIGNPNACRAVGMANSKNLIPIIIPCHRVIGKNGKLTGFAGGLDIKSELLELEGIQLAPAEQYRLF